ncbi:MAG TPA: LysM peptidoglycan-binding domain-containing protein [Nocardioidaceae bacterium]|nr:LysM peptidoglycan-binding domain-containing protein [Nocardioidaceae bacterium]
MRRVALLTFATVVSVVLLDWGGTAWRDLRGLSAASTATPADALADVAAVLALAAWLWLLLGAGLTIAEAVTSGSGRGLAPRITPAAWRRLVLSAVGIGLLSAPVGTAQASTGDSSHAITARHSPDRGTASTSPADTIRGLPLPDRPLGRLVSRRDQFEPPSIERVVVSRGDSLWAIAERHLGPDVSIQAIATEWRRWYAVNRACIGPNPNLIYPGMVLHAPEEGAAS